MSTRSFLPNEQDPASIPPAQLARVRDYRHGRLDAAEIQAFEEELLESPELRDALWLSAALERGLRSSLPAIANSPPAASNDGSGALREPAAPRYHRPWFALAAGVLLGAIGTFAALHPGADRLSSGDAVIATLDVERELTTAGPAAREIRLPPGTRSLVLELPVGPTATGAFAVRFQPTGEGHGLRLDLADVHASNGFLTVALPAPAAGNYEMSWTPAAGSTGIAGVRQLRILRGESR
jgi:hypothetical protein